MKVERIRHYLSSFSEFVAVQDVYPYLYKWEALQNFQKQWNVEDRDLKTMYDKSLYSKSSGRLWGGEHNSAKSAMLTMIKSNDDFMRSAFRDLFLDQNDLSLRYRRFFSHCDEAMRAIELSTTKKMPHHHSDFKMCSVYLTFQFPDRYTFFDFEIYKETMGKLEIMSLPESFDVVRFAKLSRALYNFMLKDEALIQLIKDRLGPSLAGLSPNMILVHDFYEFMTNPN